MNLRKEEYAQDSRIPTIDFGTPLEDAERRDLTINALFYNLNDQKVEDFTGKGLADLRNKLIRTPLEPLKTFLDDPLRVLRAFRFAARYLFEVDPEILAAAKNDIVLEQLCYKVSKERIGREFEPALENANSCVFLNHLHDLGLLQAVLAVKEKTLDAVSQEAFATTLQENQGTWNRVAQVAAEKKGLFLKEHEDAPQQTRLYLMLASLANGFHKLRYSKSTLFCEHLLKNCLKLKNKTAEDVKLILLGAQELLLLLVPEENCNSLDFAEKLGLWVRAYGSLHPFSIAILLASTNYTSQLNKVISALNVYQLSNFHAFKPPVTGNDVMEAFKVAGKEVKPILEAVNKYCVANREATKSEVLEWLRKEYKDKYELK